MSYRIGFLFLAGVLGVGLLGQIYVGAEDLRHSPGKLKWGERAKAQPRPTDAASFKAWIDVLKSDRDPAISGTVSGGFGQPAVAGDKRRTSGTLRVKRGGKTFDVNVTIEAEMSKGGGGGLQFGSYSVYGSYTVSGFDSAVRPLAAAIGVAQGTFGSGDPTSFSSTFSTFGLNPNGSLFVGNQVYGGASNAARPIALAIAASQNVYAPQGDAILYSVEHIYYSNPGIPFPILETIAWVGYNGSTAWPIPAF